MNNANHRRKKRGSRLWKIVKYPTLAAMTVTLLVVLVGLLFGRAAALPTFLAVIAVWLMWAFRQ